jgi:hypothetical protein
MYSSLGEANVPSSSLKAGLIGLGVFTVLCGPILGLWAYARWANRLPPWRPAGPPMPSPNGYTQAVALLAQLPSNRYTGPLPRWPDGPPDQLRRVLLPARPLFDRLRATFHQEWRAPLVTSFFAPPFPDTARFREGALFFVAGSILARSEGDLGEAMQCRLDAMELGSKVPRGGGLDHFLGAGWLAHDEGFVGAERLAPVLPATAIPRALARVRRIRQTWPRFAEMLEGERVTTLASLTELFQNYQQPTPISTLRYLWEQVGPEVGEDRSKVGEELHLWLTPKRAALRNLDCYFRQVIARSQQPVGRRPPIPLPSDAVSRNFVSQDTFCRTEALWWGVQAELALLEVALAVRMHRLEQGRYPTWLSEIRRRWLPSVPRDPWGQPIRYRLKQGQPMIYSLGPDGQDDGGQPVRPRYLPGWKRGDLVFGRLLTRRTVSWPASTRSGPGR